MASGDANSPRVTDHVEPDHARKPDQVGKPDRLWEPSASAEAATTAVDRLTFFCDAVVPVAMTLLALDLAALDLAVPEPNTGADFLTSLDHHLIGYLAFSIVLVPFATRLLYSGGSIAVGNDLLYRFGFYTLPRGRPRSTPARPTSHDDS